MVHLDPRLNVEFGLNLGVSRVVLGVLMVYVKSGGKTILGDSRIPVTRLIKKMSLGLQTQRHQVNYNIGTLDLKATKYTVEVTQNEASDSIIPKEFGALGCSWHKCWLKQWNICQKQCYMRLPDTQCQTISEG